MQQFVKDGPVAHRRRIRRPRVAGLVPGLAGVVLLAGIALATAAGTQDDDHLLGGPLPSAWLTEGASIGTMLSEGTMSEGMMSEGKNLTGSGGLGPIAAERDAMSEPQTAAAPGDVFITYRITSGNAVGLTVVNNGLFGNNFRSRSPSFEYPLGSNIDHMPRGGIWVGGITLEGDTLLTTATVDGAVSDLLPTAELLPVGGTVIEERSILPESRYYDLRARSEQDFLYSCADTAAALVIPSSYEPHRPLHLRIDTESLLFSFDPFEASVLVNFNIVNIGIDPIRNLRVGMYSELASGYKSTAANWTSGWFKKKRLEYLPDSTRLLMEHYYNSSLPGERPTSWSGIKLLGSKPTPVDSCQVSFNWWNWDPAKRWRDSERYRLIGNGETDATTGINPGTDDPVEVVSVCGRDSRPSAFDILEPGDTLSVSFAFVGGQDDRRVSGRDARSDLIYNAAWAQKAYDLNFLIPSPPPSPHLTITPGHNKVTLEWNGAERTEGGWRGPEVALDPKTKERDFEGYRVYISEERSESGFRRVLERDLVDGIGYDTGLSGVDGIRDSLVAPAETLWADAEHDSISVIWPDIWHYRYVIDGVRDGFKYWVAVTAFDRGTVDVASLESGLGQNLKMVISGAPAAVRGQPKVTVFPNPYRGDAAWDGSLRRDRYLWFANLPPRCTIRIYTLAGDLVDTIEFDQATYQPIDIRGIYDPTDPRDPERDLPELSGGMAAWDLVSRKDQGVASGLYLYSVESHDGGDRQVGKFLIIK